VAAGEEERRRAAEAEVARLEQMLAADQREMKAFEGEAAGARRALDEALRRAWHREGELVEAQRGRAGGAAGQIANLEGAVEAARVEGAARA
jgi:hypothetical protein